MSNKSHLNQDSLEIFGVFILSKWIKNIIAIKKKYAFISIKKNTDISSAEILFTMNHLSDASIEQAIERFEEALHQKKTGRVKDPLK